MVDHAVSYAYRPSTVDGVREVLQLARATGRSVVPRGTGNGYGDVALNGEQIVLDMTRMNRILDWDPTSGRIRVEAGVTVGQLWKYTIEDGWWPHVVPGTMHPTLGGCAAANVHGKNNWLAGTIGEHITDAQIMLPNGELVTCTAGDMRDLFRGAIGGMGLLGVFVNLTLQMKRVSSGVMRVRQLAGDSIAGMFDIFRDQEKTAQYLVGWIDGLAGGRALGRGLLEVVHDVENYPAPRRTLRREAQELPDTLFGIIPRSAIWRGMKPTVNDPGMRIINAGRFATGSLRSGATTWKPHVQVHFFHDYVPNWKRAFLPGGIVQYQVFVPELHAPGVFAELLMRSHDRGLFPYLCVMKRHRADTFLLQYNVDGYSLSLDYHATASRIGPLRDMLREFTDSVVLPAGGRFFLAKDSVLRSSDMPKIFGHEPIEEFLRLKQRMDPDQLLQSDLYRRLFRPLRLVPSVVNDDWGRPGKRSGT
jgi:FAD/FMN-containing dehydrogenase